MKHLLIGLLKLYRLTISPLYGDVCRYWPSCSAYALGSVEHHGAIRGSWLAARRLGRCHPWARGGYDPVPGTPEAAAWADEQRCGCHGVAEDGHRHLAADPQHDDRTGTTTDPVVRGRRTTNRARGPLTRT